MREEVKREIATGGWTKDSLKRMYKVDSFLRESQRYSSIESFTMQRKAMTNHTLSDGTFLPKGSIVVSNAYAIHRLGSSYDNANEFKPFRFSDANKESASVVPNNQLATISNDYLVFGHGRQAWYVSLLLYMSVLLLNLFWKKVLVDFLLRAC